MSITGLFVSGKGGKKRKRTSPIEHVFHGTPPDNLDSILRSGMDPICRADDGDFFATDPRLSIGYTKEWDDSLEGTDPWPPGARLRLLVFLVLTLPPGLKYKEDDVVVMNKVEYELPISEVTVLLS